MNGNQLLLLFIFVENWIPNKYNERTERQKDTRHLIQLVFHFPHHHIENTKVKYEKQRRGSDLAIDRNFVENEIHNGKKLLFDKRRYLRCCQIN